MSIITPDWVKDAIFYQIFPDRFAKSKRLSKEGLNLESWKSAPTTYGFKGGDLLGILEHLDYLQDLGINAIYLNPITSSASNHRYHTYDYIKIDPLLGGDAAFRELLDGAHGRGMRIIMDGVFNHASRGLWQFHHVLENGAGSPYTDWFYFNPDFLQGKKPWGAYPSPEQQEQLDKGVGSFEAIGYQAWWNLPALPKFNTNHPPVREFIFNAAVQWIKFGADGWRLDVPAEINDDPFWQEFRRRVKAVNPETYIVGELWQESKRWLQGDQFDAVMNYILTGGLMGWLIGEKLPPYIFSIGDYHKYLKPLNAVGFADWVDYLLNLYDPAINFAQFNLLDSHDTPRFITTAGGDQTLVKLGWLFLFTFIGAPCIYYGDEIGLSGGRDPACRGAFPWDEKEWDHELRNYVRQLTTLRHSYPALRSGTYQRLYAKDNIYSFARCTEGQTIIVVINAGLESINLEIPLTGLKIEKRSLKTLFGEGKAKVTEGRLLDLKLAPRCGIILG
jgi:cyclomaltodextrinase / maltogenic alpha-amylase / neopullulanase